MSTVEGEHVIDYGLRSYATRSMPSHLSDEDRESFLAIGQRAANEAVNCYTVLSLGMQAYIANKPLSGKLVADSRQV